MNDFRHKKKGNIGVNLFLGMILFNIFSFIFVYAASSDSLVGNIGSGSASLNNQLNASTDEDLSSVNALHWYDGFNISLAFDLPWWFNLFYVTFQAIIITVSIYALIRGLA